ncbi:mannan endo-1,4-beta-mannosidase-like [Haliotis asinina]|uniref:mannan endo-1,4-beta-mannosidase-like n=1 Tax=Haliotis asinina TaxID=109174 RepID=UPI003531BEFF
MSVSHLVLLVCGIAAVQCGRLAVQGNHFVKDGQKVFLSGANLAWVQYAYDFGNNLYKGRVQGILEGYIRDLSKSGGNSLRVWIHMEGANTPEFDSSGHVIGMDKGGTMLSDLKSMLNYAASHNVLVFLCLWNGAVNQGSHAHLDGLIRDTNKLQSYINKALVPMVKGLAGLPGLGGWEVINEPEGVLMPDVANSDPCFDTTHLKNSGAGWAGKLYKYDDFLRFINLQAAAIKSADPHTLVTMGSWNAKSNVNIKNYYNHYSDACLIKAGGKKQGVLDFYQIHSYDWQGKFDEVSPFTMAASAYHMNKPIVIGEFRESQGAGMTIQQMFSHAYNNGYSGAWSWSITDDWTPKDTWAHQQLGIATLANKRDHGLVKFNV